MPPIGGSGLTMEAHLQTKDYGVLEVQHLDHLQSNTAYGLRAERAERWKRKRKASGEIWLSLEDNQKVHVKTSSSDPAALGQNWRAFIYRTSWDSLQCLDALFSIA